MRQRRWVELLNDYDCEIRYHPGKANVVADALSRKGYANSIRLLCSQIMTTIKDQIREAQHVSITEYDIRNELSCGAKLKLETKSDGILYYLDRICIPDHNNLRDTLMKEAHKTRYSVHPGADKMYQDLRYIYWWSRTNSRNNRQDSSNPKQPSSGTNSSKELC